MRCNTPFTLAVISSVRCRLVSSQMKAIIRVLPSWLFIVSAMICLFSLYASLICRFTLFLFTALLKHFFGTLTRIWHASLPLLSSQRYTTLMGKAETERLCPPLNSLSMVFLLHTLSCFFRVQVPCEVLLCMVRVGMLLFAYRGKIGIEGTCH